MENFLADYVTTPTWKRRRNRALTKAGWKCQKCGRQGVALFVVHRTFARVGHERPTDLVVMCGDCFKTTPTAKTTDRGGRCLLVARDVFASERFDTLPAFVDALKVRYARLRWRYDADRLSAAIAAVWR